MLPGLHGWHEAKVGAIVRNGVASEARYIAVWGEQDEFHAEMRAAPGAERWQSWKTITWIADGARGNWTLAETVCPTAIQILDFMHAVQNGVTCGKVLLGDDSPWLDTWRGTVTRLLSAGAVDQLVRELMDCTLDATDAQLEAIAKLIGYYRFNQSRMDYPRYRAAGLPIGSGIARKRASACAPASDEAIRSALESPSRASHGAFASGLSHCRTSRRCTPQSIARTR